MLNCPSRSISSVTVVLFLLFSSCASDLNRIQLAEEYANLGGAYIKLRDMNGAISYLKRSLELDEEDTETQFNLAFALLSNKEIANHLNLPPVKLHCSMLAEDAIKSAIKDYKNKNK